MTWVLKKIKHLAHDTGGASLIEFTLVFPIFAALAFGAVDLGLFFYRWNAAAKATHLGARAAIVNDAVAAGLTNLTAQYWSSESYDYYKNIGLNCQDASGNLILANCPQIEVACAIGTGDSGTCTSSVGLTHGFMNGPFIPIFNKMRSAFPELRREHVRISYRTTGLGFAGRPNLPMEVSVSIRCMTHSFFFSGFYNIVAPAAPPECPGAARGWLVPASMATLTAEDFQTVDNVPAAAQ